MLTSTGNGYFCTRGSAEWADVDDIHYPGTYTHGCYNRETTIMGGRPVRNEDLVNLANWLVLELRIGGMVLFTVALGVVFAWLRFRSGSVWPPTPAHAALNAQYGFALLVLAPAGDSLLRPAVGVIGVAPIAVLALGLIVTERLRPDTRSGV